MTTDRAYECARIIDQALENCEEIEDRVCEDPQGDDELPERAAEFVDEVRPKLESVNEYIKKHLSCSEKQFNMVKGIAGGLEQWLNRG